MAGAGKILRKTGRIALRILLVLVLLIVVAVIFINTPPGKRLVRNQVEKYLEKKLKTEVNIGAVDYSLPKYLELKNVFFADQKKDTLFFGEMLSVDLDMIKLIGGNTEIHEVNLKNIYGNISRAANDSFFNYQFIINAFTGNKPAVANPDTAEMKFSMERVKFDNVALNFSDSFAGTNMKAVIKKLDLSTNKFSPDRLRFGIDELSARGVQFSMITYKEAPAVPLAADTMPTSPYQLFLSAKKISLRDVDVLIDNKVSGLYYANKITNLGGEELLFDIADARGTAKKLYLDSSAIIFSAAKPVLDSAVVALDTATTIPWVFAVDELRIRETDLKFDDNSKPVAGGLDFAHIDAKKFNAAVDGFKYSPEATTAKITQLAFSDKGGFALDSTHLNVLFTDTLLSLSEMYIKTPRSLIRESFSIRYDSLAAITKYPQNSLVSAILNGSTISFDELYLLVPALEKSLPRDQFAGQYLNVSAELRGNLARIYIPSLQLSGLSGSRISGSGTIYNVTDPARLSYDLYFNNINLFKRDLLRFVPPANQAQFASLPELINVKGRLTGTAKDLSADVTASGNGLSFAGLVKLTNISDPLKLGYDLNIRSASANRATIAGFLPPALQQQLNLPAQISATGKFSGNTENIDTDLRIGSSYGPLTVKGYLRNIKDPQRATYDMVLSTPGFAAGTLLKQDSVLGNIAGTFSAKGRGFDYKTMSADIAANIKSLQYNKYTYQNADIRANLAGGLVKSNGRINDENLKLDYTLSANVRGEYPTVNAEIDLDTARLGILGFVPDTLNLSLHTQLTANSLRPRALDASLLLDSVRMQRNKEFFVFDTTSLVASSAAGIDSIVLRSPFAQVDAGGAFDYDKLGPAILQYVNNYYKLPAYTAAATPIADQQFAVRGVIRETPLIKSFVPGLTRYDEINFSGSFSSAAGDSALNFNATVPQVSYSTTNVNSARININSRNGRINYEAAVDTLAAGTQTFYGTRISGGAAQDSLSITAFTQDRNKRDWFGIAGSASEDNGTYTFRLQDTLLLNFEKWNVAPDNYISYAPAGLIINRFLISSDTSNISLQSTALVPNSPINIDVNNFNLASVSSIINQDTTFISGVLDVKANVSDLDKTLPGFTGNASVTDLRFQNYPLGTLTFDAQKQSENNVSANLALLGPGNDLAVRGNYYLNNESQQFDADLQLRELNFRTLQAFSAGAIRNASGNISGNLKLNGKFTDPRWNGRINFDTAKFTVTQLGTPYLIDKQSIQLEYPDIRFPNFTINDSLGNALRFNGNIRSRTMLDYDLNIDIDADDFVVVNAKKAVESQVYGFAAIDADVSVTGTSASPNIEGTVAVNDKSDLTIVLPEASYAKNDTKTIVRFIDRDTFDINPPVKLFEPEKEPAKAFAQFLNYNLNIEINKEAALSILVDPVTGDMIRVQGDARLNVGVDPGGNLVLAGTYELDKGYYDLHYQFLQRKFSLIKGSTITFAGAPLNATANITAEYIANTSSRDLLSNQVTDVSPTIANSFNQKLPFRVLLYLSGPLSKPNITFDIQLPEENNLLNNDLRTTIEAKLAQIRQDPASINKQVFSLLLLGRFVNEQSSDFFKGNGGGGFNDLARQSVSQFLSSALNEIAGDLFQGIDIDLNLNSYNDFTNGGNTERTDLNVAVSKSFADDRITVSVGSTFGVEGQDATSKTAASNSGFKPDVSVAYKLTKDGKYLLRAYTKNQYEVTLDGFVVENGLAFLVTMDFDKFSELFRRKKPRK